MIKIESFAKKYKTNESSNSGGFVKSTTIINNNSTTTEISKELDTHTLWGQPFNGTQDVSGDLTGVGNLTANGNITTTGNINGNTVSGATVSATNVNAINVNADNIDVDNGTIDTLNSVDINNSNDITTDGISANTGRITTLVSTDGTITNLTVDNLTAKAAHFFELTIDEIKSVGGQLIVTPANASLDKVEKIGNTYKCYFKSTDGDKKITNQFAVNDQVVCSSFNAATGTSYDVSNKFYWAKVSSVSNAPVTIDGEEYHYIIIDWTDKDSDSNGVPSEGDKIAQLGNKNNTARQAAIIISAYQNQFLDNGISAPSIVQYDGINDYNLSNHRLNVISKGLNQFKGNFTTSTGDDIVDLINDMGEGALTYVHTAYANSADGATDFSKTYFNNAAYIGLCSNHTESDSTLTYTDYRWSRFRGGDGLTYYTWIRYADTISADGTSGTGISNSPTKQDGTFKEYIGFAYNKTTATESNIYADYKWTLFKGTDGIDGIDGIDGVDGKTYYTWIKYADVLPTKDADIYDTPTTDTVYIGIATNKLSQTESSHYSDYVWSKFRGDDGVPGKTPYIQNGYWYIDGESTGVKAVGLDGETPRIVNGYWWIGNVNTGVKAEGTDGNTPYIQDGYWYIDGISTGIKAIGNDGNDAEFYRLVRNIEKAIVDKNGTLGIALQYQIVHIVGNTITTETASTNGYWVRFKTDNSSTYYNLSTGTTTPKYTNANFMTNYHKETSRPIYLTVQLMYQTNTVKDTVVVPVIFDAAATLTITDEIQATVQANKTEIDGELLTINNDLTTVTQKADSLETTVNSHTTSISTLNGSVQSNTTSISNLNQRADSISARVTTNENNITDNQEAIAQLIIDTDGISSEVTKNTNDISNLYNDANLFGSGTYYGTVTSHNKFFIKDGTAPITTLYMDRYNTVIYETNFDCVQTGNGNSGLYTPYVKFEDNTNYTLAFDNINCESASRIDFQLVSYSSEYDAKNDTNGTISTYTYYDVSDDLYEEQFLSRFSTTAGWKRIKIKITCTGVSDNNEANLYGSGIRLFKGKYTNWNDLPTTAYFIEQFSSNIYQSANEISSTVNNNVIESANLLEQTNFESLSKIDKWQNSTNLTGIIETGYKNVNAYKVNITGGNQVFLSQCIYKSDLSVSKVMPMRKYTFSCYFKDIATGTQPTEMNNVTFCICKSTSYTTVENNIVAEEFIYTESDWQYFTATFTMPQVMMGNFYLVIRCANMQTPSNFYICMPKLEIGNVATEYTKEVSDASSSLIKQTADKIKLQVQNCGIDIDSQKITLNGNTQVNGALTISDEDTGFILQGSGGSTQISPKSVGTYDTFIQNSNTNVSQTSTVYGGQGVSTSSYYPYTFINQFNIGNVSNGKTITFTPSSIKYYKEDISSMRHDITTSCSNQTVSIVVYENGVSKKTVTNLSQFTYTSTGTGIITVKATIHVNVPKSIIDIGGTDILIKNEVLDAFPLSWTIPNDAYSLLGYDGLGLNLGTSANVYFNKDNAIFRYGNYGLKVDNNGVTKWNGSAWVNLSTPTVYSLTGTNYTTWADNVDIVVTSNSNAVSVTLPSNPYTGRLVYIRKSGSGNITVTANKTMRTGYSGYVNSYSVNNAKLASFLYDGSMWLINYAN